MRLDEEAEMFIFDTFRQIQRNSKLLAELVNTHGTPEQKWAYKDGVYAPVVRLSSLLHGAAMDRCRQKETERLAECEKALANFNPNYS